MTQLILHLFGDYVTQSSWMADNKTKRLFPAAAHATVYALPFLLIGSQTAVFVIWFTHLLIDRFRLARFVVFAKNFFGPRSSWPRWSDSKATGYPSATPMWLSVWLMIIADNAIHLAINSASLAYL